MKIRDRQGRTANIFPYYWDGSQWVMIPERIYVSGEWRIIYWQIPTLITKAYSAVNLDGTRTLQVDLSVNKVIPSGVYRPPG